MKRSFASALALTALSLFLCTEARAGISEAVQKKFKGQILISPDPLPDSAVDEAESIRQLQKANTSVISRAGSESEGVAVWRFHFLAFMDRKPGVGHLSLNFYTDDKKKEFVAEERLTGIDGTLTMLRSEAELTEEDGLLPDRDYLVKLTADVKGREIVLATTRLHTK